MKTKQEKEAEVQRKEHYNVELGLPIDLIRTFLNKYGMFPTFVNICFQKLVDA